MRSKPGIRCFLPASAVVLLFACAAARAADVPISGFRPADVAGERGRIVLVRYGKSFRGLKVRNAERLGAAGVIIYSDPADDGYMKTDPYPRGPARPEDAIQRGSVQFLSEAPGDPTTPGWPSTAG